MPIVSRPSSRRCRNRRLPKLPRILVVDDNRDSADTLALWLELHGYQVRALYTGLSALQAAMQFQPDMVLLDLHLPAMDGYEIAKAIRQIPGLEKVVMIATTAFSQDEFRSRAREAGFDHYFVKPEVVQPLRALLCPLKTSTAATL
jgi:CheY-like chemotaxis protein